VLEADGKITDMLSFYILSSSVWNNKKHKGFKAAYSYYNVATTCKLKDLVYNSLILAKNMNCDVFNTLNIMNNQKFLQVWINSFIYHNLFQKSNLFKPGSGFLHFYFYNYRVKSILAPEEVAMILVWRLEGWNIKCSKVWNFYFKSEL